MFSFQEATLTRIRSTYVIALSLLAALVVLCHGIIHYGLHELDQDAGVINLSGRQRMLSQRIVKSALALATLGDEAGGRQRSELEESVARLRASHRRLLREGAVNPAIGSALESLTSRLEAFAASAESTSETSSDVHSEEDVARLRNLLEQERALLPELQRIVDEYQSYSEWKSARAELVLDSLLAIALVALLLEGLFVFEPLRRTLGQKLRELEDSRAEALKVARAKDEFLATMSHEIRTPLNGILGLNEILLDTDLDDEQRDGLRACQRASRTLLRLVNDILDFAKIDAGHLVLETIPLDVHQLVHDAVRAARLRVDPSRVAVDAEISDRVPRWITGDPTRLRQVITNLLDNAVKFTKKGSVRVAVDADDSSLKVAVQDTGVGIPADRLDTIFEKFTQGDSSTTREFGGTGLGLAISRELARQFGGDLLVESEPGVGSTFRFEIPLETPERLPETAAERASEFNTTLEGVRVLAAEDGPDNRRILIAHLAKFGCELTMVENGREAVAAARDADYDVILMDCRMP
ncbi:MAG: type IV pili methyl-accepting chemotaxis transducer N-terminal domain-containing protein, partial [Planctomycetes bacterium]|nr:type IV pili methyl-accepting chemotaxis transducer N-terminal domain-containing protein [Planctomycetota bacterium]